MGANAPLAPLMHAAHETEPERLSERGPAIRSFLRFFTAFRFVGDEAWLLGPDRVVQLQVELSLFARKDTKLR